jgi:hypothetical protein
MRKGILCVNQTRHQAGRKSVGGKAEGFPGDYGFKTIVYNPCCFTMPYRGRVIIMVVWVNDISTAYHKECQEEYENFRMKFRAKFQLKELGPVRDCLGMGMSQKSEAHELSFKCRNNIICILKQLLWGTTHPYGSSCSDWCSGRYG